MTVRVVVSAEAGVAPPLVGLEVRDDGGLVLGERLACDLGARVERRGGRARAALPRRAAAACRRALSPPRRADDPVSGLPLHALDDALRLFVFPSGESTGAVLLDGDWTMEETGPGAPIGRA